MEQNISIFFGNLLLYRVIKLHFYKKNALKKYFYLNTQYPIIENKSMLMDLDLCTHYCLVMQFVGTKELKQVNSQIKQYNEDRVLEIFSQILLAVKYLHDMNIVHGDLNLKVNFNFI
jgi:serine/threonine protein kinase